MQITVVSSSQAAADAAATWIARRVRTSVRDRGVCRVAVSGGSTPALMLDALATMDLPWRSVHLFQVDERVAADGDPDRNTVQLTDHLLSRIAIPKGNVHLMGVTNRSLTQAAAAYAAAIGPEPLDIVHLGCGDDGHTASWPPGDDVVNAPGAVAVCGEFNGRIRMTILPSVVNAARSRMVLAVGAAKAEPLAGWLVRHDDIPISHVRRTRTTLITDVAGAADLDIG